MAIITSMVEGGQIATTQVRGLENFERLLEAKRRVVDPREQPHRRALAEAAGMTLRYTLGLARDSGTPGRGILPVDTGRLFGSMFSDLRGRGRSLIARVATNLYYAPYVEENRGFMEKTERDMRPRIVSVFGLHLERAQ